MKQLALIIFLILNLNTSFSQDTNGYYEITFQLEQINNASDAKHKIIELRKLTKEVIFYFNDDTDMFTLKTKTYYTTEEFMKILKSHYFRPIER